MDLSKQNIKIYINDIKGSYPKYISKNIKKIIKLIPDHQNRHQILNLLNDCVKDSKCVKTFLAMYSNNKDLAIGLLECKFHFKKEETNYYLKTFGKDLLLYQTLFILDEENKPFINQFTKYIKNDLNKSKYFLSFCNSIEGINYIKRLIELGLPEEEILNNIYKISVIMKHKKYIDNLEFVKKIIKVDIQEIEKLFKVYIAIDKTSISGNSSIEFKKFFKKNLIENYSDDLLSNYEKLFLLEDFSNDFKLRMYQTNIFKELLYSLQLESSISFPTKKQFIGQVIFSTDHYSSNLDDMLKDLNNSQYSEDVRKYLEIYKKYKESSNSEQLMEWYKLYLNSNLMSQQEMRENIIVEYNKNLKTELIKSIEQIKNNKQVVKSEEVYISKLTGEKHNIEKYVLYDVPFLMLTTSLIVKSKSTTLSEEQMVFTEKLYKDPRLWTSNPEHGTNYISMSLNDEDCLATFGKAEVILGFYNTESKQIKFAKLSDAGTNMDPETKLDNMVLLRSIKDLTLLRTPLHETKINYNELGSSREGVLPDYILVASTKNNAGIPIISNEIKEWAAYYSIPIFEIDCQSYFNTRYKEFENYFNKLKQQKTVPTLEELYNLQNLKAKAYIYASDKNVLIDSFFMIMQVIDMDNRQWNEENIFNLKEIINYFSNPNVVIETSKSNKNILEQFKKIIEIKSNEILFNNENKLRGSI